MTRSTRLPRARLVSAVGAGIFVACSPSPPDADGGATGAVPGAQTTFVYTCPDGYRFTADTRGDSAIVALAARELRLPHVAAASGARYESDHALFWNRGTEAMLEVDGELRQGCQGTAASDRPDEARLWGADFYALGQEPGWIVEVNTEEWIRYVGDYGETRLFQTGVTAETAGDEAVGYVAEPGDGEPFLRVVVSGAACEDVMSGQPYPYSVDLFVGDRSLAGCGMAISNDWP